MISKILKIQLFLLFVLTVISFFVFYYQDVLPDSYFSISSNSESVPFVSYYFTSLIAVVGYYSGPWIFIPFVIFGILYSFVYSKRTYKIDVLNVFPLIVISLTLTYFFFPIFLGQGLDYFFKSYVSPIETFVLLFFSLVALIAGTFRSYYKESIIRMFDFFISLPANIGNCFSWLSPKRQYTTVRNFFYKILFSIKTRIPSFLKGDAKGDEEESALSVGNGQLIVVPEIAPPSMPSFDENESDDSDNNESENIDVSERKNIKNNSGKNTAMLFKTISARGIDGYYDLIKQISTPKHVKKNVHPDGSYFSQIIMRIEDKLTEFKIDGEVINVLKGPVVDTFELELGPGVKVARVTSSAEDLSLALYGAPIRIVYPMKGRTTVGIEVPRNPREIIYLDELLNSPDFKNSKALLPLSIGKDAFGEPCVVDLTSMPHMLVAGATGAGKSVFINTLLVSLLVKKSPEQMKLILIDPKQLELALYAKLPHLCMPVITDAKIASLALLWAVQEMERRYSILKDFAVRNIAGFNDKLKTASPDLIASIHHYYENKNPDEGYELPFIVIVIDEFADLILTKAGKEIENTVCRLAAKARAAGIHLILATQRPSVDVITGLIKSNFPTRVSFRVTTGVDSRTILNAQGAEKLLGKGDMLYKHGVETSRVHSAYVDENEIEALASTLESFSATFDSDAMDFLEGGGDSETDPYSFGSHITSVREGNSDDDALYNEAVEVVVEQRAASASMLQRRLKIGYNRAANLIDIMENRGIVGPAQGSKPRKVL